jgi:hypothetical protein
MRIGAVLVGACTLVVSASCGGSDDATSPAVPTSPAAPVRSPASARASAGEWERETTCAELVQALREAGLTDFVADFVAGNGFVPGVRTVDELADPQQPCKGAVPRKYSHFFTGRRRVRLARLERRGRARRHVRA